MVDGGDHVGPRQAPGEIVVALQIARVIGEPLAAVMRLLEARAAGSSSPSRRRGRGCAARRASQPGAHVTCHGFVYCGSCVRCLEPAPGSSWCRDATSTVNGSPTFRGPDADLDVDLSPRGGEHPPELPRRRIPDAGRRASIAPIPLRARAARGAAHDRPAWSRERLPATARAGRLRVVQRLRQHGDVDRRIFHQGFSSRPRPSSRSRFETRRRRASSPWRA